MSCALFQSHRALALIITPRAALWGNYTSSLSRMPTFRITIPTLVAGSMFFLYFILPCSDFTVFQPGLDGPHFCRCPCYLTLLYFVVSRNGISMHIGGQCLLPRNYSGNLWPWPGWCTFWGLNTRRRDHPLLYPQSHNE